MELQLPGRRLAAWTLDAKYFVLASVAGYVCVLRKGALLHTLDLQRLKLATSIASIAIRRTTPTKESKYVEFQFECNVLKGCRCELLVLAFEGKLLRVALPRLAMGVDPSQVKKLSHYKLGKWHRAVTCMALDPVHHVVAVSGLGTQTSSDQEIVSVWDFSDETRPPKNIHITSAEGARASVGWFGRLLGRLRSAMPHALTYRVPTHL